MKPPKPPSGLGQAGKQLWTSIVKEWELDAREAALLKRACQQADVNQQLEKAVARDGVMIEGASGQRKFNTAVTELRNGRLALASLLGRIALPSEDENRKGATETSRHASKAANARWNPKVVHGAQT